MHYLEAIGEYFNITHLFKDIYDADKFSVTSKTELVTKLIQDHNIKDGYLAGDRKSDFIAGTNNNLFTIACTYGYGTSDEYSLANNSINNINEIVSIVI
ncbi:hypothetical protein [Peribacillus frigoritolerans]|uniref:hypothetical protein n=1 Tax=Peribacillus frigoritolerans TaxID=450367 RepID=UPI003DA1AE12